jgi:hypothetical protein
MNRGSIIVLCSVQIYIFKTIVPLKAKEDKERILGLGWDEVKERLDGRLGHGLGDKLGNRLGDNEWKILKVIWENRASSIPEIAPMRVIILSCSIL